MAKETVLVDGVDAIAAHNGVYRVSFFRLDTEGKPETTIELLVPAGAAEGVAEAFAKLRP